MADKALLHISSDDILLSLCDSVRDVLSSATGDKITYTPMLQKISKISMTPDIGTFVMFTGEFSGMVVINFPKETAMELYRSYMLSMGFPDSELATLYTSEEVGNSLGELMNQILGNFTKMVNEKLHTTINQSQPKMLVLPTELELNINVSLDNPRFSKLSFYTQNNNVFFMEVSMDDTEFVAIREFEENKQLSPDEILQQIMDGGVNP